jgi:hypothetical protein
MKVFLSSTSVDLEDHRQVADVAAAVAGVGRHGAVLDRRRRAPWTKPTEQDLLVDPTVIADPASVAEVLDGIRALQDFKAL